MHRALLVEPGAGVGHAGLPRAGGAVDAEAGDGLNGDPGPGHGAGTAPGTIVVLNGTPRAGKSSVARALQRSSDGIWVNLGVDAFADVIPERLRPGIGLRPGGERHDLEDAVVALFDALYASVVASSRCGLKVVVDVGHHDDYSKPLGILARVAGELRALPAYFVGVRCPVKVIMARRDAGTGGGTGTGTGTGGGRYVTSAPDGTVPDIVGRWERAVHDPGLYDLEVDTSSASPEACAASVVRRLAEGPPVAFAQLAQRRA